MTEWRGEAVGRGDRRATTAANGTSVSSRCCCDPKRICPLRGPGENRLLALLPRPSAARAQRHLEAVALPTDQVLFRAGEAIDWRLMLPMSLTYDHRVINGADAARFVVHVAAALSKPEPLVE